MPIDIASGRLEIEQEDAYIPGKVPLIWDRRYSTSLIDQSASPVGRGWTCRYFTTLRYDNGQFEHFTPKGGIETFANPDNAFARGQALRNLRAFKELFREGRRAVVRTWDVETGDIWRYVFDPGHLGEIWRLSAIEDITSLQGVDLTWSSDGALLKIKQRLEGRQLVPSFDAFGTIRHLDLLGRDGTAHRLASYVHDDRQQLLEVRDAAGSTDCFEYDLQGRVIREMIKDGGVFNNRYDANGRCVLSSGLAHYHEKRLRFIDGIRVTEVTNSYGEKSIYQHLPTGQTASITDPLGGRNVTDYDDDGRIVAETDATGSTTRYTYDAQGNRDSLTDPLGHRTQFTFNDHHQVLSVLDATGHLWMGAYDEQHRLISTMDPLDGRWSFRYDSDGNVAEVTNPLGNSFRQQFDRGVLERKTDWMGEVTHYRFDEFGRVTERRGPLGDTTGFRYDVMGNSTGVTLADGAQLAAAYDHAGNLTHYVDANGHVTRWRYGPCSRLLERTDPNGATVRYLWGSERGRLDAVINELGESYVFERDEAGRIVREVSFDGASRCFELNAEGRSVAYTNANQETIAIVRDPLHRVTGQRLPDGEQLGFEFDALGRLVAATTTDISLTIQRDALGRVTRETQGEEWVSSHYDAAGNLLQTQTSRGLLVKYGYDANGRMLEATTSGGKRISFERDAEGLETVRHLPGGGRLEQRFDTMGRLLEQRVTAPIESNNAVRTGRELLHRSYAYDRNGRLTCEADACWGQTDFDYDPADRLLASLRQRGSQGVAQSSELFEYDLASNLTRIRFQSSALVDDMLEYGPGNRLTRQGSTTLEFDAEGRRIKKIEDAASASPRVWLYGWDALGRLRKVTRPDGSVWGYQYDGLARRVSKARLVDAASAKESVSVHLGTATQPPRTASQLERFVWDQDVIVHQLPDGMPAVTWLFESTSFAPLARLVGSSIQVLVNDHLGTPREIVDEDGSLTHRAPGRAWEGSSPDETCPIGFQGQWWDQESGLRYNRHRYYDAHAGRFLSDDPTGLLGGLNLQRYGINPISWVDPLGLLCKEQKRRLRKIEELASEPGNDGTKFAVDRREARQLGEAFVGPGHTVERGDMHGEVWLVSADKKRLWRSPTPKDSDFARTGVQANFHERNNTNSGWFDQQSTSNVHVHVKD